MIDLIDAHHGEGQINWPILKQNAKGAIVKAHDGYYMPRVAGTPQKPPSDYTWHFDPRFAENWAGAKGMQLRGAYSFIRFNYEKRPWDKDSGMVRQADMFCEYVMAHGLFYDDVLVADVEQVAAQLAYLSRKQITDRLRQWIYRVEDRSNKRPVIYTGWGWWNQHIGYVDWAKDYLLWVADYTPPLRLPLGWDTYWAHQYTDDGKVPGIRGYADLNVFGADYVPPQPRPEMPSPSLDEIVARLKRADLPIPV